MPVRSRECLVLGAVLFLTIAVYARVLDGPWIFDDVNVRNEPNFRLTGFSLSAIARAAADVTEEPTRFLPNASFALNFLFFGDGTTSFHAVNLAIHLATVVVVFLLLRELLLLAGRTADAAGQASLFGAAFFALSSMQTEAVSYIWQRGTPLCAFFVVTAVWLTARSVTRRGPSRLVHLAGAFVLWPLATFSKQHGALLPAGIALTLWLFAYGGSLRGLMKATALTVVAAAVAYPVLAPLWWGSTDAVSALSAGYDQLPFSFGERLMSQARVVIRLAAMFFVPLPSMQTLDHDVAVSESLLDPPTTLACTLFVLAAIGLAFRVAARRPLVAFGLLFFFLTLIPESVVAPLELMFEYRVYLPSVGLALLLAAAVPHALAESRIGVGLAAGVVLLLAAGTFTRNAVWTSTERMWTDAATKSPKKARPWYQLGALREIRGLRAPAGSEARERELMEAERLYGKALRIAPHRIFYEESLRRVRAIRSGDADQLVLVATARLEHGKPEEAVPLLREAEALDDGRGDVPYYLAIALARVGRGPEALAAMRRAMARGFDDPEFLRTDEALAPVRALPGFPDLFQ